MSVFMSSIDWLGLSEYPPESKVTPFPMIAILRRGFFDGVYVRWISRDS